MKRIVTLVCILCTSMSFSQIEGTWKLADQAAALGVGPNQGDISWWASSAQDLIDRACLFDDSINFDVNGTMTHYMDGSSWVEAWQGAATDGCDTPVAPHDGMPASPYTYAYDATAGTLTVNGLGAHLGLAKVYNAGELASPAGAVLTITYMVTFTNNNNSMTLDISIGDGTPGSGFWRFEYDRIGSVPAADPTITFRVDMSQYAGTIGTAVNLSGDFNGWCGDCAPMTDLGNGIWELDVQLPAGPIQYKFSIDNWTDQEVLPSGGSCVDTIADGFDNRAYVVATDDTLPDVCFASCDVCMTSSLGELNKESLFRVSPNPVNNSFVVNFEGDAKDIAIMDLAGRVVQTINNYTSGSSIDVSAFESGLFLVVSRGEEGTFNTTFMKD